MAETVALIVAAGRGARAQGEPLVSGAPPKQYWRLAGRPVLRHSIDAFLGHQTISSVQLVIREEDRAHYESLTRGLSLPPPVIGGATRQDSVRNGLEALCASDPELVLIHDGARPFPSAQLISNVVAALEGAHAVAPMQSVTDTLRRRTPQGYSTEPREGLFRTQTPQGFRFGPILQAHRKFSGENATDDFGLAERAGLSLANVPGDSMNIKLTTPDDFLLAERLALAALTDIRTGTGIDVHRFTAGDVVMLCGIKIPHDHALEGHSDADVGLHALTDAILGAIGAGDIGTHFPPSDEKWRGSASDVFLGYAANLVRERKGAISHVDVTLICERPKIAPHRESMRHRIAGILNIEVARVSVKATTTEGLGFTGRREGIAAQAVATIRLP